MPKVKYVLAYAALSGLIYVGVACAESDDASRGVTDVEVTTGTTTYSNPTSQRIAGLTDCVALQAEFDQADRNGVVEYMKVADKRMKEVGCYGD